MIILHLFLVSYFTMMSTIEIWKQPDNRHFKNIKLFSTKSEIQDSKKGFEQIPIIFITAISKDPEYLHKGYEAGAVNYLFKPIDPDELKRKVNVALQHQRYKKKMAALEAMKKNQQ